MTRSPIAKAHRRSAFPLALAVLALLGSAGPASADPSTVRVLVGSPAGGPADLLARLFRDAVATGTDTPANVVNRPGAGGTIAAQDVATSRADGRTLLVAGMGSTVAAPYLFPALPYRPSRDLRPVTLLATSSMALVVPASGAIRSAAQLAARARGGDGTLLYASSGAGSANHLCAEEFARHVGFPARSVPFQGDAQAQTSVARGDVEFMFMAPSVAIPLERGGRVRILATTGRIRTAALGHVPTLAESGFDGLECLAWTMVFAPARTPDATVSALARAWQSALDKPGLRSVIEAAGLQAPSVAATDQAARLLRSEQARLGRLLSQGPPLREPLFGAGDQELRQ